MPGEFSIQVGLAHIYLLTGDITTVAVDAIVNAANAHLGGGGGVDGAIHRAGGPSLMRELDAIRHEKGGCPTGSAVVTTAGKLPAKYVIHAVGPVYRDGRQGEPDALRSCYETSLRLAAERECVSISFPSISTGVYGYPLREAARIAVATVRAWLRENTASVRTVKLVQFSPSDHQTYLEVSKETAQDQA